jgi:hypothetical protein
LGGEELMHEPIWSAKETDYLSAWKEYTDGWVFADMREELERYDDFVAGYVAGGMKTIQSLMDEIKEL